MSRKFVMVSLMSFWNRSSPIRSFRAVTEFWNSSITLLPSRARSSRVTGEVPMTCSPGGTGLTPAGTAPGLISIHLSPRRFPVIV